MEERPKKEIELGGKKFVLHMFPPVAGRHILTLYSPGENGVIEPGNSQQGMLEAMRYVSVKLDDGREIVLETEALVNSHVPSAVTLMQLESTVLDFNFSS